MNQLPEVLEKRRTESAGILDSLFSATPCDMDGRLGPLIPIKSGGLYLIARKHDPIGQYLRVGKTKDLRRRVCSDHCSGGGDRAHSDLIQKVIDKGEAGTRADAQSWIRTHCTVQWVVVADKDLQGWAEHYLLSIVQPIWGS
jgi:hypothetical protein